MKYAVISDIHGNMQALNSVLNDSLNVENADKILCLGDLAMAGPEPSFAVQKIQELIADGKMISIKGNTDKMLAFYDDEIFNLVQEKNEIMANALKADVKVLTEEQLSFLRDLPEQYSIEQDDIKVLMVHGSPRKIDENIFPDLPIETVEEMVEDTDASIILCGHTHVPCGYQTNSKKTVVNVGSVGRPFSEEPKSCYAILEFLDEGLSIRHKFVDYDTKTASQILEKRGYNGCEKLAKMLLHATSRYPQ